MFTRISVINLLFESESLQTQVPDDSKTQVLTFFPATPKTLQEASPLLYSVYFYSFLLEAVLLIGLLSWAVFCRKDLANQPLAVRLLRLLFISNVCALLYMLVFIPVRLRIESGQQLNWFYWTLSGTVYTSFIVADACFSVTTWLFAHNYFTCSTRLKIVEAEAINNSGRRTEKPVEEARSHKIFFWAMLALNIGTSFAWGTFRLLKNLYIYYNPNGVNPFRTEEVVCQMSDGLLQVFSFIILSFGVCKIRSYVINSGLRN